jgi:hypothetical protein
VLPRAYAARRRTPAEVAATVAAAVAAPPPRTVDSTFDFAADSAADSAADQAPADDFRVVQAPSEEPVPVEAAIDAASPDPVTVIATAPPIATSEPEPVAMPPQEQTPASPRPTPRSVTVPMPSEELRPVPPPPAADHARAAVVTAATTVALALGVFVVFGTDDGRVTSESSGIAAPVPTTLDSLPPLTFPLPDTGVASRNVKAETTATSQPLFRPDSTSQKESTRVAAVPAPRSTRPPAARTRKRLPPIRRSRVDSPAAARDASRRAADSIEREAIRRELEHRRARLDSIARSLEPPPVRPRR